MNNTTKQIFVKVLTVKAEQGWQQQLLLMATSTKAFFITKNEENNFANAFAIQGQYFSIANTVVTLLV